jgi:nicotinamidase/pyrazinamidase
MSQGKKTEAISIGIIVVDMQNDFSEAGALPVANASETIPVINKILEQLQTRATVVYSRDWHPLNHCSFQKNGGEWPVHCVEGSKGAELISGLVLPKNATGFVKGFNADKDSYSAFGGVTNDVDAITLDNFLKDSGVKTVYVMGLATDYCVKETALDAMAHGYKTIFVENASKGVSQDTTVEAINAMTKAGVHIFKMA